ncbi:MAG: hypothetical protein ACKOC5_14125 [Chloroflexota bacterium]
MYPVILATHNLVRWAAIILGIVAFGLALASWLGTRPWSEQNRKFGSFFGIAVDIQLLLGLLLYFTSPLVMGALQNLGAAMGNAGQRFFAVEHPTFMVLGVVFAHLGTALPRRQSDPKKKAMRAALFIGLAVLFILAGTPWDRRLLPF